jgi:hypothetical protein
MAGITYPTYRNVNFPAWAGDFLEPDNLLPGGARLDPTLFNATDAAVVVVGVAGAAQNATAVPVAALANPIPAGTVLWFSGAKYAHLTAAAAAGATSLTVSALPTALVSTDTATYPGIGKKSLDSGVVLGRTFAERDAGTPFGPVADTDDEIYIVAFAIDDITRNADVDFVRPGNMIIKENLLPGTISVTVLGKLRGLYTCVRGKTT